MTARQKPFLHKPFRSGVLKTYRVKWIVDVEAFSPTGAAFQALDMQRDHNSTATVFEVSIAGRAGRGVMLDLDDLPANERL